ncbi:hypothetical protein [Shewanella atlantica]|uniref:Uncharacterized protein n=1 Tax=Shewanella atlantica TaxID=271099 RepID=A0A431W833_9GAMM|nr:hypothetical protein [Shewanella atlantica]RTR31662.1 hypothetical protein EKG39_13180 [Shewanella atlantica]
MKIRNNSSNSTVTKLITPKPCPLKLSLAKHQLRSAINKYPYFFEPLAELPTSVDKELLLELSSKYTNFYHSSGKFRELSDETISSFVQNDEYIRHAHQLLSSTLGSPAEHLEVSIDDCSFTLELSSEVWKQMGAQSSKKPKGKHAELMRLVKENSHGEVVLKISHGSGGELAHLYGHHWVYRFSAGGEIRFHYMPVDNSSSSPNGKHKNSETIRSSRISFRLSSLGINNLRIFLSWLRSLSIQEYDRAVFHNDSKTKGTTNGAYITRIDFEAKFYALPFPFLMLKDTHHSVEHFAIFPKNSSKSMASSAYSGDHANNSHFILYDAVLKLIDKGLITLEEAGCFVELCKIERRLLPSKNGNGGLLVTGLDKVNANFERLYIYSPKVFQHLPEKVAVKLARFKSDAVWGNLGKRETKQLEKVLNDHQFKIPINADEINLKCYLLAQQLQRVIMEPSLNTHRITEGNSEPLKRSVLKSLSIEPR